MSSDVSIVKRRTLRSQAGDANRERPAIHVDRPRLPIGIDRLTIHRLAVGSAKVDLTFQRVGDRVAAFAEGQDPSPVPLLLHS